MHLVGLFFNVFEVLGLLAFVFQAGLVAVQDDVFIGYSARNAVLVDHENGLRNMVNGANVLPVFETSAQL